MSYPSICPKGDLKFPLSSKIDHFTVTDPCFIPDNRSHPTQNSPSPPSYRSFSETTSWLTERFALFLEVEPRKYRFRLLNGSNSRFYTLSLTSGQSFVQIGTDGGLLGSPVRLKKLTLGPAERADIILDFSKHKGQTITLTNSAPFPAGTPANPQTTGLVMQFRVTRPLSSKDKSSIPGQLSHPPRFPLNRVRKLRNLSLVESTDRFGRLMLLLDNKKWADPVTEKPLLGSFELWQLINTTPDNHPIHLHLVSFRILNRQRFDIKH